MKRGEKQADFLIYLTARFVVSLPYRIFQTVVTALACLLVSGNTRVKKVCLQNLKIAFPEKSLQEKKNLLRQIIREISISLYHGYRVISPHRVRQMAEVEGIAYLGEALNQKKGVIALSAHLSNFGLLLAYLSQRYPFKAVVNNPRNPYIATKIMEIRRLAGISEIPKKPADRAVTDSLHWLKSGNALFLLADEHRKKGIPVPFLGCPVSTSTTPAVLSRRLDCVVLPISIVRQGQKYLIRIEPSLNLQRTDNLEADIRQNTALFNKVIEKWVRDYPDQWFGWFTRRFLPPALINAKSGPL